MGGVFLTDRIVVNWGTVDQVKCEIKLFRRAYNDGYDYYHLLSGCDLLIKPIAEFISFVESHQGKEFFSVDYYARNRQNARDKINYYYLFLNKYRETSHCARLSRLLGRITIRIQRLLGVNRCRYEDFEYFKGHNWMSLTNAAVSYILSKEEWINNRFRFTFCPDEIYKQTLLMNSNFATSRFVPLATNQSSNLRLIDWVRGGPYTWRMSDKPELLSSQNYIARKFSTSESLLVIDWIDSQVN